MITWAKRNRESYKTFTGRQKFLVYATFIAVGILLGIGIYLTGFTARSLLESAIATACFSFLLSFSVSAAITLIARLGSSK